MKYWTALSAFLAIIPQAVIAANWIPPQFVVVGVPGNGFRTYFNNQNGTIQELGTWGAPYTSWAVGITVGTNVAPATEMAGIGYTSANGTLITRIFFQTTNGDLRSALYSTECWCWGVESPVVANIPIGSSISAFQQAAMTIIQYTDAAGRLTQRLSAGDEPNWGAPLTINT